MARMLRVPLRREILTAPILLALLVALGALGATMRAPLGLPVPVQEGSAGWEGRRLLAQLLWAKTHAVLHAGVEERPARPGEQGVPAHPENARAVGAHPGEGDGAHSHGAKPGDDACPSCRHGEDGQEPRRAAGDDREARAHRGHSHGEEPMVLAIPAREADFRGVLGDLERSIKPYAGSAGERYEKDADQTLPYYRLMVSADPHFVQGWVVGSAFLCRAGRHVEEALALLREGERHNPDSFEIQTELGHLLLVYRKDYPVAAAHLERALRLAPPGRPREPLQEDALQDAYRWLALTYREAGQPQRAVEAARRGLAVLGPDATLLGVVQRGGRKAPPPAPTPVLRPPAREAKKPEERPVASGARGGMSLFR